MRTLAVLAALLLTGLGLAALTAPSKSVPAVVPPSVIEPAPTATAARFELLLSAEAEAISMDAGGAPVTGKSASLTGTLEVSGKQPVIFLRIRWADGPPGHRFARLRLEIPGQPTREHVFTAAGDIDDVWEP